MTDPCEHICMLAPDCQISISLCRSFREDNSSGSDKKQVKDRRRWRQKSKSEFNLWKQKLMLSGWNVCNICEFGSRCSVLSVRWSEMLCSYRRAVCLKKLSLFILPLLWCDASDVSVIFFRSFLSIMGCCGCSAAGWWRRWLASALFCGVFGFATFSLRVCGAEDAAGSQWIGFDSGFHQKLVLMAPSSVPPTHLVLPLFGRNPLRRSKQWLTQ